MRRTWFKVISIARLRRGAIEEPEDAPEVKRSPDQSEGESFFANKLARNNSVTAVDPWGRWMSDDEGVFADLDDREGDGVQLIRGWHPSKGR